jgi:tetratricopeptide (TPR) repeat protein
MERLLSIKENIIDDQQQVELLFSLITIANQASHLNHHETARHACNKVLQVAEQIKMRNPDVWNPNLHVAVIGGYLNRGNAQKIGGKKQIVQSIEDYSAAIKLCDEFEARSGANERIWVIRLLAKTNKSIDWLRNEQKDEAQALIGEVISEEDRIRKEFGEKHYSNHETELILSFGILLNQVIPLERRELIDGVAGILLRLAAMTGANVSNESAREQADWRLTTGDSLLLAGCRTEAVALLQQGVDLGRKAMAGNQCDTDINFLNNLGYCLARLREQDEKCTDFSEAKSYLIKAMGLLNDGDDYMRSITFDSLGYIQTLSGARNKDADLLKTAITTFEEARRFAIQAKREDLVSTVERHIAAARAALQAIL